MLRFYIALAAAKSAYLAIKLLKHSGGTSFAGMVALKICPDFLKYCNKYVKSSKYTVTGTNGKTTTAGMLAHILEQDGEKVIHNVKGANMLTGIANVFALSIPKKFDCAVLESDEAYLTKLYDYISADFLIVTNLFRDQLDGYGELATTAGLIQSAIDKTNGLLLFLNADDPLVANMGKEKEAFYYGFEEVEYMLKNHKTSTAPSEVFACACGEKLQYSKQFFAQEGHYYCPKCDYKRPDPDCKGYAQIYDDYTILKVEFKGQSYYFILNTVGLYNAYNALGAITCALVTGVEYEVIKTAVKNYKSIFGRTERKIINGHNTLIQLIKNPTGASEVLKTVDLKSNILIAINDNYADGRDVSWLWDADFEQLKDTSNPIVVSGIRAKDMAVRLKYAGVPTDKIKVIENLKQAVEFVTNSDKMERNVTILPTYTALLSLNKMKF